MTARPGLRLAALLALLAPGLLVAGAGEWDFTVYLDDRPIGTHRFTVQQEAGRSVIDISADFRVRLLFLTVYAYRHDNREEWKNGCLQRISARTDDNGDRFAVDGERSVHEFVLRTPEGETSLPSCVQSFAYWDPRILEATRLLNAQNGEYMDIRVESLGPDSVPVRGIEVEADRYRLVSGDIGIDLWYSPRREWLALESTTENGARLRYRIE